MKISILTPTYNRANLLKNLYKSILTQNPLKGKILKYRLYIIYIRNILTHKTSKRKK